MITFLEGSLVEKQPTRAVLEVGGVGYEVFIPLSTFDRLPAARETCRILTHEHVREDAHQLFGFITEAERAMFQMLLTISGIGPKLALSTLSGMSVREIKVAAVQGDVKRLSSISGIGKKTAERIAVELRHRIGAAEALEAVAGAGDSEDTRLRDAALALASLGYKQADAVRMVRDVLDREGGADLSVEGILRKALAR